MKTQNPTQRDVAPGDVLGYRAITVVVIGVAGERAQVRGVRPGRMSANTLTVATGELVA